ELHLQPGVFPRQAHLAGEVADGVLVLLRDFLQRVAVAGDVPVDLPQDGVRCDLDQEDGAIRVPALGHPLQVPGRVVAAVPGLAGPGEVARDVPGRVDDGQALRPDEVVVLAPAGRPGEDVLLVQGDVGGGGHCCGPFGQSYWRWVAIRASSALVTLSPGAGWWPLTRSLHSGHFTATVNSSWLWK